MKGFKKEFLIVHIQYPLVNNLFFAKHTNSIITTISSTCCHNLTQHSKG